MASNDPNSKGDGSGGAAENIPRGLLGKGGTPISKSARLPSVRAARDLTLGGAQRKSFKPNIPVRPREKASGPIEDKLVIKEKRIKKEKTDRPVGGKGRGGRGQPSIIQSQSIFESGPTERTVKRESIYGGGDGGRGGGGSGGGSGGNSSSRYTSSTSVLNVRQTKKETQAILDELLRDDLIDHGDDVLMDANQPVSLPLLNAKKYEEAIKIEMKLPEDVKINAMDPSLSSHVVDHNEDSVRLVLVQLPDCLPGLMSGEDEQPKVSQVKQEPTTSQAQPAPAAAEDLSEKLSSQCKLSDISEGKIGKIQVLKSGKTRLVLGDVTFDLSLGSPCGFLQELVYVNADDREIGQMACLGPVKEKLVVIPSIDSLLET